MNEDKLIQLVLQNTEDLKQIKETMVTKVELMDVKSSLGNTLDHLVKLAEKKDEELTLLSHGLRQVEDTVKKHEQVLKQLAPNAFN